MAYNAYTVEEVFLNPSLNTLCDRLMNYAQINYSVNDMALTGAAARMINGDDVVAPTRAVIFITENIDFFDSLKIELLALWRDAAISSFKDRYQVTIYGLKLEIWYAVKSYATINTSGIITQQSNDIPSNLL